MKKSAHPLGFALNRKCIRYIYMFMDNIMFSYIIRIVFHATAAPTLGTCACNFYSKQHVFH